MVEVRVMNAVTLPGAGQDDAAVPNGCTVILAGCSGHDAQSQQTALRMAATNTVYVLFPEHDPPDPALLRGAGVAGAFPDSITIDELLSAVAATPAGPELGAELGPDPGPDRSPDPGPAPDDDRPPLSRREREVLMLIASGLTHQQVARRMQISIHTVNTYVRRIREKWRLGNKAELVRAALPQMV